MESGGAERIRAAACRYPPEPARSRVRSRWTDTTRTWPSSKTYMESVVYTAAGALGIHDLYSAAATPGDVSAEQVYGQHSKSATVDAARSSRDYVL